MKVLVLSDSHGDVGSMERAVRKERPDMIFHLGDCWRDADALIQRFPDIPFYRVPGNCDFRLKDPTELKLTLCGRRILLCHGHTYGVKEGLWDADEAALEQRLDAFLFGHTHIPLLEMRDRTLFLNPGSIGMGHPRTYAILTVDPSGRLDAHTVRA